MWAKALLLCFFAVFYEYNDVECRVCTRTILTQVQTFTLSGGNIRNLSSQAPIHKLIHHCCPGYYTFNPLIGATSENCLPYCKKSRPVDDQCFCPEEFSVDTTLTLCIPKCPTGQDYVEGICQLKSNVSSSEIKDEIQCIDNSCPSNKILYVSATVNMIFFIILLVLLAKIFCKKRKASDQERNDNISVRPNDPYMDMTGAQRHQRPPLELPVYESINEPNEAEEPLCYDYVQTPLPFHMRKANFNTKSVRGGAPR